MASRADGSNLERVFTGGDNAASLHSLRAGYATMKPRFTICAPSGPFRFDMLVGVRNPDSRRTRAFLYDPAMLFLLSLIVRRRNRVRLSALHSHH
jgi:hypothetical protein